MSNPSSASPFPFDEETIDDWYNKTEDSFDE